MLPLGASQSLSETFPCAAYKTCFLKGKALRGNRVARIGLYSTLLCSPQTTLLYFTLLYCLLFYSTSLYDSTTMIITTINNNKYYY